MVILAITIWSFRVPQIKEFPNVNRHSGSLFKYLINLTGDASIVLEVAGAETRQRRKSFAENSLRMARD